MPRLNLVRRSRSGFTLLEVILSLSLTALLFGIIGFAVDLHWRATDRGRAAVENAQLARALLARIASDLRATVPVAPDSSTGLGDLAGNAASGALPSDLEDLAPDEKNEDPPLGDEDGTDSAGEDATGDEVLDPAELSATDATASEAIVSAETPVGSVPGMYGNQFELQLDVHRAMRPDEFGLIASGMAMPSGVMTLSYFVHTPMMQSTLPSGEPAPSGLVRRETNRAVAAWTGDVGLQETPAQRVELLAPEVVSLEFRYFDGYQWLLQWDSSVMQSAPIAVEVLLTLRPHRAQAGLAANWLTDGEPEDEQLEYYRMVVHLPASSLQIDETGMPTDPSVSSSATAGAL